MKRNKFECSKYENCCPCRHNCREYKCNKASHMMYAKENSKEAITSCKGCPLEFYPNCDKYVLIRGEIKENEFYV